MKEAILLLVLINIYPNIYCQDWSSWIPVTDNNCIKHLFYKYKVTESFGNKEVWVGFKNDFNQTIHFRYTTIHSGKTSNY